MSHLVSDSITESPSTFKPTYLYIKQHSITGKLYFGMTTTIDTIKYKGSGTHWKLHIKKHGVEHVETLWYCLFLDKESIEEFALMCSTLWSIVDSDLWLNLKEENGLDGGSGYKHTKETRERMSLAATTRVVSKETKEKMSLSKKGCKRKPHTKETREKLSLAAKGRIHSKETREKMSLAHTGIKRKP